MKKARTEILKVKTKDDKILNVSIVKKQSELGLSYNERLFILVENQKFGYISNFVQSDKPENIDISKCKVIIPIKNITSQVQRSKEVISINFYIAQDKQKVPKKWTLKMETEDLAKQWQKLIIQEKNKSVIRKNQSTSQIRGDLSPKKSQIRPSISQSNVAPQQGNSHKNLQQVKSELKQDLGKRKAQNKPQKQQFQNALYETQNKAQFILQSPTLNPNQKDTNVIKNQTQGNIQNQNEGVKNTQNISDNPTYQNNPYTNQNTNEKPSNISKKLSYEQETEMKKKILEQVKKQQQEKLRQQKQQIRRKQQELIQMQRKIKEEQKRIQDEKKILEESKKKQQSGIKNGETRQVTVINQDFFHKPKQDQPKQVNNVSKHDASGVKPDPNASKSKPRIEGPNYSQFVNNVVLQKQKPQPQLQGTKKPTNAQPPSPRQEHVNPLELTHSHLLKMQQLKLQNQQAQQREKQRQLQQKMRQKIIQQKQQQNASIQFGWTYRFLTKQADQAHDQIIAEFNQFCSNVLKEVVEQFHLPQRKRMYLPKYRRQQYYLYEKEDVQFKVGLIGLKQIYNKDEPDSRDNICDLSSVKILQNQFKNYHFMYKSCQQIQSRSLKVPLTCICEYQGFVAFFKARSQLDSKAPVNSGDKKVQTDLERISQHSKINLSTLKNKQNVLIYKLNSEYYRQLAAKTGKNHTNFDYYMIQQLKNILPKGVLVPDSSQQQSNEPIHFVRPQLVLNYQQPRQDMNQTILQTLKKVRTHHSRVNNKLAQSALINVAYLIKQLDDLDFYFVHPTEISNKLHQYGINLRCLGLIYENCDGSFNKKYLMTEMAARTARSLFSKTIQDCNSKQSQEPQNSFQQNIYFQMMDFFNLILGSSNETATIWKVLSIHNSDYFSVPIALDQIQKGYFVLSLIYHCQIEVEWSKISLSMAFVSDEFFNDNNFVGVRTKIKGYQPVLNQKQQDLIDRMIIEDSSAIKSLQQEFGLHSKGLPLKFRNQKYTNIIKKYLSNFIPPQASMQRGYKLLNIYNSNPNRLTKSEFQQRQMQLKWHLKRQRKQKYLQVFSQLNSEIVNCFGNFHPFLSQLYETMVLYHRNNGQFEDSITFSKSSAINILKICGATHPKVAESYYQMAFSCIKGGKKQLAIISLQKAKNIFQANQKQGEISYAFVCMKLGLMFLSEGKDAQSIVKYALKLFNRALAYNVNKNDGQTYEEERVQCFEILSRYYELNQLTQKQKQLGLQCQKQLNYIQSPANFQKVLKIVLYPILSSINPTNASIYLSLVSQIPLQISVQTYGKGYQRLIERVDEGSLIQNLIKYLENIKSIQNFIKQNKTLKEWKGLQDAFERETVTDFISLTVEMLYFLGEGFVTGTVRDNL